MFRNTKKRNFFKALPALIAILFLLVLTAHCAKGTFDNVNTEQPEDQGKPEETACEWYRRLAPSGHCRSLNTYKN